MSDVINFTTEQGLEMFDALSRTSSARQIKPLEQSNYISYDHRYLYDEYNLTIGDVAMMIPPEFIYVSSESFSQNIQTLRQENSQKQKTGYHKRTIQIDLVFDGMDEINGYKVPGPVHKDKDTYSNFYYVDGLRTLLAQFKLTPFLPLRNELLNDSYNIFVVALQSIVISTIEGFQNALTAHLTLQEVDMMPYIEMPNMMFKHTIDWDLFRYYIQSIITEEHEYKKLQSLPVNSDHTAFKLSLLSENVLATIVNNSSATVTKEESILAQVIEPSNYDVIINSNDYDVHITEFQCSYANMLTSIQMSEASSPTLQYLGGLDTQFNIVFETTDVTVVGKIEKCQIKNDLMVRSNPKVRGSIGFVKIESDFVTFCGSLFCTIESVETHTVPGIPGLYQVRLLCVSYDIAQSRREELNGFMPFNGKESSIDGLQKTGEALENESSNNKDQCIQQSLKGLMTKIYQDNYAEWKLRTGMEVYPDLRLPTYAEVNEAITNINAFRKYNNKDQLPYEAYPLQPSNISYGKGESNNNLPNNWLDAGGNTIYQNGNVPESPVYQGFVDPDFYVFYPNTYTSIYKELKAEENQEKQSNGSSISNLYSSPVRNTSVSGIIKEKYNPTYGDGENTDTKTTGFINLLRTKIGCHYEAIAEGEISDYRGEKFDDLGLITWGLKTMGILPDNFKRLKAKDVDSLDIFKAVSLQDIRRGDIISNDAKSWFGVATGYDKENNLAVINVNQVNGVLEEQVPFQIAYVYRIMPLQRDYEKQGTNQSNPYDSDGNQYPDENGTIEEKKKSLLETTEGYTSANPYGKDNGTETTTSSNDTNITEENKDEKDKEKDSEQKIDDAIQTEEEKIEEEKKKAEEENKKKAEEEKKKAEVEQNSSKATIDQDLGIWSPISASELNTFIASYCPADSPFQNHGDVFVKAGEESGLDPRYILAHAILESASGTSNIARKKNNYFGIGAFDTSPYASAHTFDSGLDKGIIGGAKWIADHYYNSKYQQKTLNQMRHNSSGHEYATDPEWHNKIAKIMDKMSKNLSAQYISGSAGTSSSTVTDNANTIKMKENERRNRAETAEDLAEITKRIELDQASISDLTLPDIEDDGSEWTNGSVALTEYKNMTTDEFNAIALTVATECEGETIACKMAMTQYIYDSIQCKYKGNGITAYIKNRDFTVDKTVQEIKDVEEAKACVQRVFQAGARWKKDYKVLAFTSMNNSNYANKYKNDKYEQIGSVNQHIFYGLKEESYSVGYNVAGHGVSEASSNSVTVARKYTINAVDLIDTNAFGKPIYIKSKHFDTHNSGVGKQWAEINNNLNRVNTAFVDDCQYSAKGRLVKAFPTFLFCILDDQAQWYDGRKLWTNYYVYKPVIDIQYHAANDMPTETAQITVTNTYHNLDRSSAALIKYSIAKDKEYNSVLDNMVSNATGKDFSINRWLYKNCGMLIGGLKITNRLIQMHSILFNHTKVREGARVHLRMGYGSDPLSLAPIINGTISGLTLGDQISITVTSDGHELIQSVTSDKTKDINNGALGLFGLGANQESSNIISEIMVKRTSWMNHLFFAKEWFEGSKYNIEHFGLYINDGERYFLQGGVDTGIYEQYDLLMNVYKAYDKDDFFNLARHFGYIYASPSVAGALGHDGEANIVFNQYNMTPWDVFQLCAQTAPEYLVKVEKYQFDSRLYYGLPFDLTKYRYDIINGTIYQECKANTQMHYIDSLTSIIENQISVSSRRSFTNAKVIYTRGKTPKATAVIHSDDTIDHSKQSTHIIDSSIVQDYLGLDSFNEFIGFRHGQRAARRLGISNLLYGWQQQYQGQILCLGQPQVKPDDYLMINDFYTALNGLALTREVIHSFNTRTGFTTSIIPGVIGFCPEQDSGNIELIAVFLKIYGEFTKYAQSRKLLKDNVERYVDLVTLMNKAQILEELGINGLQSQNKLFNNTKLWHTADTTATIAGDIAIAMTVYKFIRCCQNTGSIIKAIKSIYSVYKAADASFKTFTAAKSFFVVVRVISSINYVAKEFEAAEGTILAIGAASAPETLGIGFAVSVLITIMLEIAISTISSWVENRNVCVLLPLWWEGKPFIAGIKDGEKILLINDENAGSEENTGEEGVETDQDELSVEDN